MGILGVVLVVVIILKALGLIAIGWGLVLLPLWIGILWFIIKVVLACAVSSTVASVSW